tara:strand:+ start:777 stop:1748 length:972 start_codon:yes stop_codon:yes gene_type:complete
MAIKSSGSSLAFSEIESEFGANGSRSLGAYRTSQNVGSLSNLPLDPGIPTSGTIKFSDFYSKRLNVVVDCHSGGSETRVVAKNDKWNNNNLTVVGGFRSKKEGGSRIIINVNKEICSNKDATTRCALRTGSWDATSLVQVDVGPSGRILGSGGNGGRGRNGIDGSAQAGFTGTSGLGIEVNNCTVNIGSGGIIRAGFGGGGGGGGSRQVDKGEDRRASGGGGGGGAGCPAGQGGAGGTTGAGGQAGSAGNQTSGGGGGSGGNSGNGQAIGGTGGSGGQAQGGPGASSGGAGANGAAIRRTSGFTVNINNSGTVQGSTTATGTS